jgi:hypothetical protein
MPTENEEIARIQGAHELGLAFVRSSILINGGGFVVLLGYMAASTEASLITFSLVGLKLSLTCFLIGVATVMLALGLSYIYTAPNFLSPTKQWLDSKIIPINAVLCLMSLTAFCVGVVFLILTSSKPL